MKLTFKTIMPFELGFTHGLIGHALSFDNRHNPYYKNFEIDAYVDGYLSGLNNNSVNIWQNQKSDFNPVRKTLEYLVVTGKIKISGFEIYKNFDGNLTYEKIN
jgi:hypothetical protein